MLNLLLGIYVIISLFIGHVMVSITYKPNFLRQIGIRLLAFAWPIYPIFLVLGAWASK